MFRSSILFLLAALVLGAGCPAGVRGAEQPPVRLLTKADALPLAIDPAFQFRKTKTFFLEDQQVTGIADPLNEEQSIAYERKRLLYGAATPTDIRNRYGNYFTFFWRSQRPANLTVRLEYRQLKLGAFVQAREVDYPAARGSFATRFEVTGDDYLQQGRVSQWRVLLVADHQAVVALSQSYLWR